MKEKITSQKKALFKVKKSDSKGQETSAFILFYWKLKPSRSWSLDDSCTFYDKEKVKINIILYEI